MSSATCSASVIISARSVVTSTVGQPWRAEYQIEECGGVAEMLGQNRGTEPEPV